MIAGIDGCKGGWLVAKSQNWPCRQVPFLEVCESIIAALQFTEGCDRVVIDIPIGIPSEGHIRLCDLEAKELLGPQGSSVFLTPPRGTLRARTPEEFQELHKLYRKSGAGLPVWGFLAKLKEVDKAMTPDLQDRIIEFHPELAWRRASGKTLDSKRTEKGLNQRKRILSKEVPELDGMLRWKQKLGRAAAVDDILDALMGLSVAQDILDHRASKLPEGSADTDKRGVRTEIWY